MKKLGTLLAVVMGLWVAQGWATAQEILRNPPTPATPAPAAGDLGTPHIPPGPACQTGTCQTGTCRGCPRGCEDSCWDKMCRWLTYRAAPVPWDCTCFSHCNCASCSPRVYTFFLHNCDGCRGCCGNGGCGNGGCATGNCGTGGCANGNCPR